MSEISGGQATIVIALFSHAIATVWWASKTNATMSFMREELVRIRKELESRDAQITALWNKYDLLHEKVMGFK